MTLTEYKFFHRERLIFGQKTIALLMMFNVDEFDVFATINSDR